MLDFRVRMQIAEALGPVNRWYCSMYYERMIEDPEQLMQYFIRSGGAKNFAVKYSEAMSPLNRWFCSQFHGREISDHKMLWDYYTDNAGTKRKDEDPGRNSASAG